MKNKLLIQWHQQQSFLSNKINKIKQSINPLIFFLEMSRKFEVIITRLLIEHIQLSRSFLITKKYIFHIVICTSCGIKLSIRHIFTEYRTFQHIRENTKPPNSLSKLLSPIKFNFYNHQMHSFR